jgi:signal transduction histidine kinase
VRPRLTRLADAQGRVSLRARLTVLAGAAAAIVLTATALLLYDGLFSAIDDAVTTELRIRSEDLAAELRGDADPATTRGLVTQILSDRGEVLSPAGEPPIVEQGELPDGRAEVVVNRPVVGIGDAARILISRVPARDETDRIVAVAGSTRPIQEARRRLVLVLGITGPAMVSAVAAMAWLLTGAALRPVARMTRRAARLSLRESDAQLPEPPGDDEIAKLGRTLNAMLSRIAATVAHERAFIDDASHELRTPLAVLRSELELARLEVSSSTDPATTIAALDSALEETDRLVSLANRLLVLARADAGHLADEPQPVSVPEVVARLVARLPELGRTIETDVGDTSVWADPPLIDQVVGNLLSNAVRWSRTAVRIDATSEGGWTAIRVADDGPGFDEDLLVRAFDRFSRVGSARASDTGGAGLGLAIVWAAATALGGSATVANGPPLGGACVTVVLPAAPPTS